MKKPIFWFLILALLFPCMAQQMNSRPLLWLGAIEDLSAKKDGSLPIGSVLSTMLQTELQASSVFRLASTTPVSLGQVKKAPDAKSYYLEGNAYRVANQIQLDVRAYSVDGPALLYAGFVEVTGEGELRKAAKNIVTTLGEQLFRDVLGRLELSTNVGRTDIYLDGVFCGKTDDKGKIFIPQLLPGTYGLRALAEGYKEYTEAMSIASRRLSYVNAALKEEPGSLLIQSSPDGATVVLDGIEVGVTPVGVPQIEVGEHNLVLRKPDFKDSSQRITVRSREQRSIQAKLEILPGSVRIVSEPKGATVFLGGSKIGTTPLTQYDLVPGKYFFELKATSFKDVTLPVEIAAGKQGAYETTLSPKTCRLNIDTQPAGVSVFLVGAGGGASGAGPTPSGASISGRELLGTTPIRDREVRLGAYRLEFEKDGYFPADRPITLTNEQPYPVEEDLRIKPGTLKIVSVPEGALVFLDGVRKGQTPLALDSLVPGTYELTAKNSFTELSRTVRIDPDGLVTEEFALKKPSNRFLPALVMTALTVGAFCSVVGR